VKNLHLGHLAKSFGLRETPGKIGASGGVGHGKKDKDGKDGKGKRKRDEKVKDVGPMDDDSEDEDGDGERREKKARIPTPKLRGSAAAQTDVEKRMYEAVRKQGRLTKVGGQMGMGAGKGRADGGAGGGEFQVVNLSMGGLEKMVQGRNGNGAGKKR